MMEDDVMDIIYSKTDADLYDLARKIMEELEQRNKYYHLQMAEHEEPTQLPF